ncbi:Protein of unknown function, DUF288 [Methylobacterium phyllostachyos]|uniref:DUF288 domain-containing protein n=1 Tax=Methylobacterium phyllostachyos TaxID=582672 RepID=A0A1G9Z0L5_9HYPH|nr:STELLO glycosyltransferase family protein [Methylobacterium phyllostachyos]SDN14166.1 Protein of unknown function, DUF288 [Methylobacterium phyllostachyos]
MSEKYAVVITTINSPTRAIVEIARDAPQLNAQFVIVGDSKSPAGFHQDGALYLDLEAQRHSGFRYGAVAPAKHYARKNVGYLRAIADGATVLIETDDDNIPRPEFWAPRSATVKARIHEAAEWTNVYAWFSGQPIWPRGLPLDKVRVSPPAIDTLSEVEVYCPIQQGLADENPDVDAIYRLVLPLPLDFEQREPVALRHSWCPFNSQNTTFFKPAFPLLYLPYYCSFRMTDIWRSFVAQRIAYANDWGVLFHSATVFQERNEHDLMRDFEEEIPGYLHNTRIRNTLCGLDIPIGEAEIPAAMRLCYQALIDIGVVGAEEMGLLEAWLEDLSRL